MKRVAWMERRESGGICKISLPLVFPVLHVVNYYAKPITEFDYAKRT